jgi:hypothetical protein
MARTESIQPRRQILDTWRSVASYSYRSRAWHWGGAVESNSISDAEQLLCLLQPATMMPQLNLEIPNNTSDDALEALRPFGDSVQIPQVLVAAMEQYLDRYTRPDGVPDFSGGSYCVPQVERDDLNPDQRGIDVLVSYAASVSLCLSALGFLAVYGENSARGVWNERVARVTGRIRFRLTAALTGLMRGFTMNAIVLDEPEGKALVRMINQAGSPLRLVVAEFNEQMKTVRGRLGEARLGVSKAEDLDNPNVLFEVGWTWGVASDAPQFKLEPNEPPELTGVQQKGYAISKPYLYFTLVALDAIELLGSERTRVLGLLDDRQERLANALLTRRELTQMYWSRLARFGRGRWPLEDLPWQTVDDQESDYFSLLVCAVLIQDLRRREANEDDLRRLEPLLSELANRARLTRRPTRDDPAVAMHSPGLLITLEGSELLGPQMAWRVSDFAPLLLKRAMQVAALTSDSLARDRLMELASEVWNHMAARRFTRGAAAGLWDSPSAVYPGTVDMSDEPAWYTTYRVTDALVTAATTQSSRPTRNDDLSMTATAMVSEAEYLLNQELMSTESSNTPLQRTLQELRAAVGRARTLIDTQPSTAIALALNTVTQLDKIELSRVDARQGL